MECIIESFQMESLFGFINLANQAPPKVESIDSLFQQQQLKNQEIVLCVDTSGSTTFKTTFTHDNKGFAQVYSEAVKLLSKMLPHHKVVCWSSKAKELVGEELTIYNNALANAIPIAEVIKDMNEGTEPDTILPFVKNKSVVLLTDGEISESSANNIRNKLINSGIGSVFLVIIPHIDSYKNMYSANQNVEVSAKDSIRLSIPQAFSQCLATVIIWNYRKKEFEFIDELSASWVDTKKPLSDILSNPVPVTKVGEFLVKNNDKYLSFSLENLIGFLKVKNIDENTLMKLDELGVSLAIRQQASIKQRDDWNLCIQNIFTKILSQKVQKDFNEKDIPDDISMVERIKIILQNDKERTKIENIHKHKLGELCGKLSVGQTVGEIKNVAAAKVKQTVANVNAFATMKTEDKLSEISQVLIHGDCTICSESKPIFKTISIPTKLLLQMSMCNYEKQVTQKNKVKTIKFLDLEQLKASLENNPPKLYFLDLCAGCCNVSMTKAKLPSDPENCITGMVPQNIKDGNVIERLFVCPLIDEKYITDLSDPNRSELSFARQTLRGFISKTMNLDPASQECLTASLMFLSSLATNKENSRLIFANQKSLLSGGRQNKYPETVGRLFKPTTGKLSSQSLSMIAIVENVVELAEFPILPESTKLLLLCLLERKVTILLTAQTQRKNVIKKLDLVFEKIRSNNNTNYQEFGISDLQFEAIKGAESLEKYIENNKDQYTSFIATYMQNVMNYNIQEIARHEQSLMNVLKASSIDEIAKSLYINTDYLNKMILRSNMTHEDFMKMIPHYISALCKKDGDRTGITLSFV